MSRLIGEAFISILPDTDQFGPETRAGVDKALAAIRPDVNVGAALDNKDLAKITAQLKTLQKTITAGVELSPAQLAKVKAQLASLARTTANIEAQLDEASFARADATIRAMMGKTATEITADIDQASMNKAEAQMATYFKQRTVDVGFQLEGQSLAKAKAEINAALGRMEDQVFFEGIPQQLAKAKAEIMAGLKDATDQINFQIDPAQLAAMKQSIEQYMREVPVELTGRIDPAQLAAMRESMNSYFLGDSVDIGAQIPADQLAKMRMEVTAAFKDFEPPLDFNIMPGVKSLAMLDMGVKQLAHDAENMDANFNITEALAKLATLKATLAGMTTSIGYMGGMKGVNTDSLAASLETIGTLLDDTDTKMKQFQADTSGGFGRAVIGALAAQSALSDLRDASGNLVTGWGLLNVKIQTFGGIFGNVLPGLLSSVHVWHLMADGVFEFAAAWAPAMIAVGAFAAYAFPIGEKIYGQWENINVILDGVGGHLTDLGPQFDAIEKAIEPSVMIAFGEWIQIITHESGGLGIALQKVGQVIDVWGAAIVNWASKGAKAMKDIISSGAGDFEAIGRGFALLGKIFGDLFGAMPGYVHILMSVGDGILAITAAIMGFLAHADVFGKSILGWALALHGIIVYLGLAVTAFYAFGRAVAVAAFAKFTASMGTAEEAIGGISLGLSQAGQDAEEATGKFNKIGVAIGNFGGLMAAGVVKTFNYGKGLFNIATGAEEVEGKTGLAAAGSKVFGDALGALPAFINPVTIGIAAAAAVIGTVLFFAFHRAQTAAEQFGDTMQTLVENSTGVNIYKNFADAIEETTTRANQAAHAVAILNTQMTGKGATGMNYIGPTNQDIANAKEYSQQTQTLIEQAGTYAGRMNTLTTVFGSTTAAQSALNLMGIKAGTIATETNAKWQTQLTELKGLQAGYAYMTQSAGAAGAELEALNISTGTTMKNLQTLTQAEAAWTSMITSGDSAFTSYEQGFSTLSSSMGKTANSAPTVTTTIGKLSQTFTAYGATMVGTSQSALAVRQAFDQQLTAATTLFGNLQELATASGNTSAAQKEMAKASKDIVAQLLPFAAGSKQATAEVSSLAQLMGGPATDNFQTLAKWVGNTKGAEADLNNEQAKLTISASNLTTAAKNLGNAMSDQLASGEASVIAKTFGLDSAMQNLATTAKSTHDQVNAVTVSFAGEFVAALEKSGSTTKEATQDLNAYLQRLGYSQSAIQTIDSQLGDSAKQWDQYESVQKANAAAAQNLTSAVNKNTASFQALGMYLPETTSTLNKVWASIVQTDSAMVKSGNDAVVTKNQFVSFATNGLGVTQSSAEALWNKFASNNLDYLASHAGQTKSAFMQFAQDGLGLTQSKAQSLWAEFAMQNLDMLASKGNKAQAAFMAFAQNGLGFTSSQADHLWNTLKEQYLDTLASKAGETERAFVATAKQFGVNQTAAQNLWKALRQLAGASPYEVAVHEVLSGSGSISAKISAAAIVLGGSGVISPQTPAAAKAVQTQAKNAAMIHSASGGLVKGGGPSGQDSVHAMLAPGELIIPTSHAAKYGAQAKADGIPGFAGGGVVGQAASLASSAGSATQGVENDALTFTNQAVGQFAGDLSSTFAGMTSGAGSATNATAGGSMANLLTIAKYLMANGMSRAAAAGMASVVMGESGGNPEAVGSGGFGLIGWTPPASANTYYPGTWPLTGNPSVDMDRQLRAMVGYMRANGGAGILNAQSNPINAGDVWSRVFERPAVTYSDTRPSIAQQIYAELGGYSGNTAASAIGQVTSHTQKPHSAGGMINEPVYGYGAYSGIPYSFAENGPEQVVPGGVAAAQSGGNMQAMTVYQGQQLLVSVNQMVKLLQGLPYAQAQAQKSSMVTGVRKGFSGTGK